MRHQTTTQNLSLDTKQIAVAQLEAVGLPLRIINLLESELGIIWLDDLLKYTPDQLKEKVANLGDKSVDLIIACVSKLVDDANSRSFLTKDPSQQIPRVT